MPFLKNNRRRTCNMLDFPWGFDYRFRHVGCRSGEIGIFYVIDGYIFAATTNKDDGEEHDGVISAPFDHESFWDEIQKGSPYAYDFFPRGRVVCDTNDRINYVYTGEELFNAFERHEDILYALEDKFYLKPFPYIIKLDEEYTPRRHPLK
jgi:hypothetical protein